jgi:hypothetical protein
MAVERDETSERLNERIEAFERRIADRTVEMVEWGGDLVEGGSWIGGGEGHIVGYERFGGQWRIVFKRVRGVPTPTDSSMWKREDLDESQPLVTAPLDFRISAARLLEVFVDRLIEKARQQAQR